MPSEPPLMKEGEANRGYKSQNLSPTGDGGFGEDQGQNAPADGTPELPVSSLESKVPAERTCENQTSSLNNHGIGRSSPSPQRRDETDTKPVSDHVKSPWGAAKAVLHAAVPIGQTRDRNEGSSPAKPLSVQDLHKESPLESEAETSIFEAVEDRRRTSSKAGNQMFDKIPPQAVESFSAASRGQDSTREDTHGGAQSDGIPKSRNDMGLESQLVALTAAMKVINNMAMEDDNVDDMGTSSNPPKENFLDERPNKDTPNQTESLFHNANRLYRRRHRNKKDTPALQRQQSNRRLHIIRSKENNGNEEMADDHSNSDSLDDDIESGNSLPVDKSHSHRRRAAAKMRRAKRKLDRRMDHLKEDWVYFSDFYRPRRKTARRRVLSIIFFILVPAIGLAALLFYGLGNPLLSRQNASTSWLVLFLTRHVLLYCVSRMLQVWLIDFLSLRTFTMVRLLGPFWSLCLVQSRGFPFIMYTWSLLAFIMLSGSNRFAKHWLFYQNLIGLFNADNPAGTITESSMNYTVLACSLVFGIAVTIKRVYLGLKFGKRACRNYGDELTEVIRQVILVSEVGRLSNDLDRGKSKDEIESRANALDRNVASPDVHIPGYDLSINSFEDSTLEASTEKDKRPGLYTGSLAQSQKNEVMSMLESWEEPDRGKHSDDSATSMNTILEFRQAVTIMETDCPFSVLFGPCGTREACVESSQKVYNRLLLNQKEEDGVNVLNFDTIAILATTAGGGIDNEKMKELIRLFRPDRDGTLTLIDFCKSVDAVYKRVRLLAASIRNSGQVDHAAEHIFNWAFYCLFFVILLSILGYDPMALFVSLSSIIVAFAFAIGSASAKYFEGLLFILARRPYDIGDRIHVSPVDEDTSANGSNTWFVENVDLFTTTIRYASTNEVATVSNGSLANSRIINAARSPKMLVYVYMKFGVDVPYAKVKLFREIVEKFVKRRPRDWLALTGFRATRVEPELGFIEYVIALQHRERWQNIVPMLNAKAEFSSFANEVAKKLEMPYRAPALPVDLNMARRDEIANRVRDQVSADDNLEEEFLSRRASDQPGPDMSDLTALFSEGL